MKKIIVFLFVLTTIIVNQSKSEIIIPNESIRYRIIANSNSTKDQMLKLDIKNKIDKELMPILENSNSINQTRNLIKDNIDNINTIVSKYTDDYNVSFGNNYFPEKTYKGINYDSGYYESLVINIGKGLGDNWWCVLYPPLCLIEENSSDNIEYTSLVKEVLNNI